MSDLIRREDAIKALGKEPMPFDEIEMGRLRQWITDVNAIKDLPSATADSFEWCTDCKEYDQEAHCCHRWTKTMRKTVEEIKKESEWIPCSERLPNTNGCYLVWRPHFFGGDIGMPSICYFDGSDTWHDSYGVDFTRILSKGDITAWMPLPEPYKGEDNE